MHDSITRYVHENIIVIYTLYVACATLRFNHKHSAREGEGRGLSLPIRPSFSAKRTCTLGLGFISFLVLQMYLNTTVTKTDIS